LIGSDASVATGGRDSCSKIGAEDMLKDGVEFRLDLEVEVDGPMRRRTEAMESFKLKTIPIDHARVKMNC